MSRGSRTGSFDSLLSGSQQTVPVSASGTTFSVTFNFTNAVIGAGIIGTAAAMADAGWFIAVVLLVCFAFMTKGSLDDIVEVQLGWNEGRIGKEENERGSLDYAVLEGEGESGESNNNESLNVATLRSPITSFETFGSVAYGKTGLAAVLISKTMYSWGCLVAYIVVLKNNMPKGLQGLFGIKDGDEGWLAKFVLDTDLFTLFLAFLFVLPLCLFRKADRLAKFSFLSILAVAFITVIVVFEYIFNPNEIEIQFPKHGFVEDLFVVRIGVIESLGTFVFAFVSQHCSHLAYDTLNDRSLENWKKVTRNSVSIALTLVLVVGTMVYITFWDDTPSDMFVNYPDCREVDVARGKE